MEKVKKQNESLTITPKMFRRDVRSIKAKRRGFKVNSNGKKFADNRFNIIGFKVWDGRAIYLPRNKKLKGWQKENKRRKVA
jgi:hypothetical protein